MTPSDISSAIIIAGSLLAFVQLVGFIGLGILLACLIERNKWVQQDFAAIAPSNDINCSKQDGPDTAPAYFLK